MTNHSDGQEVLDALRPAQPVAPSPDFTNRVMRAIAAEGRAETARRRWTGLAWPRWVLAASAVAALLLLLPLVPAGKGKGPAALLAQSLEAMSAVRSVHMLGRVRTLPGDNFELIGTRYDFVPLEMWREYSRPPRWRVEKPGRTLVMDGQASLMFIAASKTASKGGPGTGMVEWLRRVLDPLSLLESELRAARQGEAQSSLSEAGGVLTLTARRHARGNFTNDWARGTSIDQSDHIATYRFDAATKRLEGVTVSVIEGGREVSVLEITGFEYNQAFQDGLFRIDLPADVDWYTGAPTKTASVAIDGPKAAAECFFSALAHEDWEAALAVYPQTRVSDAMRQGYGGLQVLSIGEPFQSGLYGGYYVPYQVRLRNGYVKTHKLAVRNDNPQRRWMVDGGY